MDKDEKLSVLKRVAVALGFSSEEDLEKLEGGEKMDKELQKKLEELTGTVDKLKSDAELANNIAKHTTEITKAKDDVALKVVEAEVGKLEGDDVRIQALKNLIKETREGFEKSNQTEEFQKFQDKLPEPLQKSFEGMDEEGKAKFIKSFGELEDKSNDVAKAIADLAKSNEDQKAVIQKMEKESAIKKIMEVDLVEMKGVVKLQDTAEAIYTLRKTDETAAKVILDQAIAMAKQVKASDTFKVLGADGDGEGGGAEAKLEKLAKKLHEDNPEMTFETAYDKVIQTHGELYADSLTEKEA